ncbi:Arm DNA-binding domain-containing protein [Bacteroides ovatus]|nr:Arm DNA-binding domain-containing protein [Bacteroides ovatus]
MRISKDGKRKYISLGLSAQGVQWNDDADRFKKDKRVCPNYERDNLFLNSCEERAGENFVDVCGKGTKLVANSI